MSFKFTACKASAIGRSGVQRGAHRLRGGRRVGRLSAPGISRQSARLLVQGLRERPGRPATTAGSRAGKRHRRYGAGRLESARISRIAGKSRRCWCIGGLRRHGIGAALLVAAERCARDAGRTLLVLDTASGEAERLYERRGWQRCGRIPNYALWPDGSPCATAILFKSLNV